MNERYLEETMFLDYSSENIQHLIRQRKWMELDELNCVKAIYGYVRDEIYFGYNIDDNIKATKVLNDVFGQCNTKGILFMALLRACKIPCRNMALQSTKNFKKGL